jgi:hypothetical protein
MQAVIGRGGLDVETTCALEINDRRIRKEENQESLAAVIH